jgi:hypothetical protein
LLTIHASRNLASLLVTPANRSEVSLVIHEATVEEGLDVRVRRSDVNLAMRHKFNVRSGTIESANLSTASGVFKVLEHCHVFARRKE